ncbi:hypothetical protein CEXT_421961 [Caerostris extrusa]|uniref:Uncharacterized protein n=1 Tax=Caerostris extrusa TaxID=172846 RepID=A0AAV4XTV1_CAEEX|nr:hypothetical protein CEXT_421961 [Caerostris extrusa]
MCQPTNMSAPTVRLAASQSRVGVSRIKTMVPYAVGVRIDLGVPFGFYLGCGGGLGLGGGGEAQEEQG